MNTAVEHAMYGVSQLFLLPVLLAIALLFAHAFVALGAFLVQAWQRRRGHPAGFELRQEQARTPGLSTAGLELLALQRLERVRVATRVAPMLGLVATMIPMGPALQALSGGQMVEVGRALGVAFSAVILALLAAAISFTVVNVRKRWYAADLAAIEQDMAPAPPAHAEGLAPLTEATA